MITKEKLHEAMVNTGIQITLQEVDKIIREVDFKGNRKINYSEFLAATINAQEFLTE